MRLPLNCLYSRRASLSHVPPGIPEARRAENRFGLLDTEWHLQRIPQSENPRATLPQPEPLSSESERVRRPRPIPNFAGSQTHPEQSGIWNASQHQRPAYEIPSPLLANGRNVPPTPRIPVVPLPDVRRSRTRSTFGQPPNAPWVQPSISQPGAQRTSQECSDSIWQPNVPTVIHSPQVVLHSQWAIPWANYEILGSWPAVRDNVYDVRVRRQQENPDNAQRQGSDTCSNSRREQIPDLLSKGGLKWDIRFQPCTSAFDPPRSFCPDLDLPALNNDTHVAEICFSCGRRMKVFTDTWGSIYVRNGRRQYSSGRGFSPISIRDILDATYRYFMQPLTEHEVARFEAIPEQKDEMVMAYRMRLRAHRAKDDCYRRWDLLRNGMNNFDKLEVESESRNMVRLRLHLY